MTANVSNVYLVEVSSGQLVKAELHDAILPRHLDHHERLWKPLIQARQEEHGHWDWQSKCRHYSAQLSYEFLAVECQQETQGLMIVNTIRRCRLPQQTNKHLVYVEYLEVAPWNRPHVTVDPKYRLVGTVMLAAAIQLSIDDGNKGRIGLHSLPQADTFYRDRCGMTDLGPDASIFGNLHYFEMTEQQATQFMQRS
ncbi:MAG: hypothetical protein WD030_09845 [Pirellulales bacterium]